MQDDVLMPVFAAEMRAPGQRGRNRVEDSSDDYDLDLDRQGTDSGGRSGRVILLGNGTEVLTDSDEQEAFDHEDDDRDLENQVRRHDATASRESTEARNQREETPGPPSSDATSMQRSPGSTEVSNPFESPSSTTSERSEPTEMASTANRIPESVLPDKLVTPPTSKDT